MRVFEKRNGYSLNENVILLCFFVKENCDVLEKYIG